MGVKPLELHENPRLAQITLAVSRNGSRHLLVPVSNSGPFISDNRSQGVDLSRRPWVDAGVARQFADLRCSSDYLFPQFSLICAEVISVIADVPGRPDQAIISVLERWRDLLRRSTTGLGREELVGLYAELLFIRDLVRLDANAIHLWNGPHRSIHDIVSGRTAVEIKGTTSNTEPRIVIHGENQLWRAKGDLWLLWIRLELNTRGCSLADLVEDIQECGVSASTIQAKLLEVGASAEILEKLREMKFVEIERRLYFVGQDFPRIVQSSFVGGMLPERVSEIRYTVDLSGYPSASEEQQKDLQTRLVALPPQNA